MNAFKRHPLADRAMVDWDLLVLMEPLTLAGALAGGFVNKVAPELVITVPPRRRPFRWALRGDRGARGRVV